MATGAVLLAFALRSADVPAVVEGLRRANFTWSIPFLALLFGFYALKAARWGILIRAVAQVPFRLLFRAIMIGYASNALLPAQLGDVVRALVTAREMGLRTAPLVTSVLVERAFDFTVVVGLLGGVLVTKPELADAVFVSGLIILAGCTAVLVLLHAIARSTDGFLRVLRRFMSLFPEHFSARASEITRSAAAGAHSLANWGSFLRSLGLSAAKWLLMAGCIFVSLKAIGVDVPVEAALLVLAWTTLAMVLPSAPGYIGAIQAAYVLGLGAFNISPSTAIAASLFFHALSYASVVVAGLAYAHASGYRLADLSRDVRRTH